MFDPKDILTKHGYEKWNAYIFQLDEILDFIIDHNGDLHMTPEYVDRLYRVQEIIPSIKSGDGEKDDD